MLQAIANVSTPRRLAPSLTDIPLHKPPRQRQDAVYDTGCGEDASPNHDGDKERSDAIYMQIGDSEEEFRARVDWRVEIVGSGLVEDGAE